MHMQIPNRKMTPTPEQRQKALEILETGKTYGGEETERFEVELAAWCGRRYGATANSGTSICLLALDAKGIGPGDEVILPANGYVGVLAAVVKRGATPVFAEADAETSNIRPDAIAAAVTSRTRAVVAIHDYGFPCDMDPIVETARSHGLFVIEDAAHALGAEYKERRAGGIGDMGFFSFSGKMISAFGPGGGAVTDDRDLAEGLASLRDQGRVRDERISFIRRTDTTWYDQRWVGYNMHMTELCAALARLDLRMLPAFVAHRRRGAAYYTERFRGAGLPLQLPPSRPWAAPSYLHYTVWTPEREALREALAARGIEAIALYPTPLHLARPVMDRYGTRPGQFPTAERLCRETLSLPVGPHMTDELLAYVADAVIGYFAGHASSTAGNTKLSVNAD
ncbi:MAG TPA: DegT/DnrJ/EryC1/StrS family aminotransferase [bacterium]|nr:DegT/DnrJ/EryC1/StrS family aminotransferase [bacterium]